MEGMYPADSLDQTQLLDLLDFRGAGCVTLTLASSPIPADHERVRGDLRSAISDAERQLEQHDIADRDRIVERLRAYETDEPFWTHQSRGLVLVAAADRDQAIRLDVEPESQVIVADRFAAASLLRAAAAPRVAWVVQISQGAARLLEVGGGAAPVEHDLALPDDHATMLEYTDTDGQADYPRPQGATGEQLERERYCRAAQDAVVAVAPADAPLILNAARDLERAYRDVNTHRMLLDQGIDAHPDSLTGTELDDAVREILQSRERDELSEWKERFGTLRADGLATTRLEEVAAAAAASAIEELRIDVDADPRGTVDEFGRLTRSDDGPSLIDDLASRVLHAGGVVRAVTQQELLDGSPVAATLRFPVEVP